MDYRFRNLVLAVSASLVLASCGDKSEESDHAPILSGVTDSTISKGSIFDPLDGITASDEVDGDLTAEITLTGSVDSAISGDYSLEYHVTDTAGNTTRATRTITVNTPPHFTTTGSSQDVMAAHSYSQVIVVDDADGDDVEIQILSQPDWLSYDSVSKTLSGSPTYFDVGFSDSVTIELDDGLNTYQNSFTLSTVEATPTPSQAHRLLVHSTYGPTTTLLNTVQSQGMVAWLDGQLNMDSAYTSATDGWLTHLERTIQITQMAEPSPATAWYATGIFNEAAASSNVFKYQLATWFDNALGSHHPGSEDIGSDQLRQRVAYALSQLLVTSDAVNALGRRGESLAYYYDILAKHAFGNYRDLLGEVSRSATMGVFLSHMGNRKANPSAGTRPDENFAREVLQLFSIGLYQLNLDGSPDRDGDPSSYPDSGTNLVPSYTQNDVEELAKVMTGWDLQDNDHYGRFVVTDGNYAAPMEFTAGQHEDEVAEGGDGFVTVLGTTFALDADDGSAMDSALNVLFNHQNVAPYVSKHLIQRLVTSNPSAEYLARVSAVFNDNGYGERGDLKAVVRAILLDQDARGDRYLTDPDFGKAKEPILALMQLFRATAIQPLDGWISIDGIPMNDVYWAPSIRWYLNQGPMRAPSVFNFYNADFVPSDSYFSSRRMVAPELQIQMPPIMVNYNNSLHRHLNVYEKNWITQLYGQSLADYGAAQHDGKVSIFLLNLDTELNIIEMALDGDTNGDYANLYDPVQREIAVDALLDHVDTLLLGGTMTTEYRAAMKHYLISSTATTRGVPIVDALTMARDLYRMAAASSLYMIQK